MRINSIKLVALLVSLVISQNAFAHSPIKGIGFLFNGILHPFLIPSHVLVILVLGFLIGQLRPQKHRISILLYLLTMIAGLSLAGFNRLPDFDGSSILLILAVLLSIITLPAITVPVWFMGVIAAIVALVIGLDSQTEDLTGSVKIISLVGNGVGSYLMLLYATALSETLSVKKWQQIGIRILTSWLAASAFMVLALNLSHN